MNIIIGDIGNTITKICLVQIDSLKVKKIVYLTGKDILSKRILRKKIKKNY